MEVFKSGFSKGVSEMGFQKVFLKDFWRGSRRGF